MRFKEENNILLKGFLERTFFDSWKKQKNDNFSKLEMIFTPVCNLGCRYCYIHRHGKELYPEEIRDREVILRNLRLVLKWLAGNGYVPWIDLFSGELLAQKIGIEALEIIAKHYENTDESLRPKVICIPTNYTFLLDEDLTRHIEGLIDRFRHIGIRLALSASVDGKYQESNRPLHFKTTGKLADEYIFKTNDDPRDDSYYEKLFAFNKKSRFGFHPMIYSRGIEKWKDNFLWFQENFRKHGISPDSLYLLEVRNEEWTPEQCAEFAKFVKFLIEWTWELCRKDLECMKDFVLHKRGYNILGGVLTNIGRGLGCSLQSTLYLRLGDLAIVPCHRTMYAGMEIGRMVVKGDEIVDIEAKNVELGIGEISFESNTAPMCETCLLKFSCSKGCLGSQYESTGDLFSPIPSVCMLEHAKFVGMMEGYKSIGIWDLVLSDWLDPKRAYAFKKLEGLMG